MRTQQEILRKFEEAYVRDIPFRDRVPLHDPRLCECNAFAFPHLPYAGDCQGVKRG